MADNRELALLELKARVTLIRVAAGLKAFKRTPTKPIQEQDLPCVFMHEGTDVVNNHSSRDVNGFPRRRILEVEFEVVVDRSDETQNVFRQVRAAVFGTTPTLVDGEVSIIELRTEGPTGYGLPDVTGKSLVIGMRYFEKSF